MYLCCQCFNKTKTKIPIFMNKKDTKIKHFLKLCKQNVQPFLKTEPKLQVKNGNWVLL